MRHILFSLLLTPLLAVAASPAEFDPVKFEKRFRAADKNMDGKLSRAEARPEFPRMPEFFDEIDANHDGLITLVEVDKAMQKRVNAALAASKTGNRYALPKDAGNDVAGAETTPPAFASRAEASRHYRYEYYDSIAGERQDDQLRGQPTHDVSPQMQKSF